VLKTIEAGLDAPPEIAGFLGFGDRFLAMVIDQMKSDEMIAGGINGRVGLLRRGKEALKQNGDCIHIDKTIFTLWDPVTEGPIVGRQDLVSERTKQGHELRIRFPAVLKTPEAKNLDVKAIQAHRRASRELDAANDREDILRLVGVRRTLHKFRRCALLIYGDGKSAPIVKIAVDGQIDERLSSAFTLKDGAIHIGVDQKLYRRAGALAVDSRLRDLDVTASGKTYDDLSRRRAVLNWRINSILPRLADDDAPDSVRAHVVQYGKELAEVEAGLADVPVRHIAAAEFPLCLKDALCHVKRELLVTTTVPNESRFTADIERSMEEALQRGVRIKMYIADRVDNSPRATSQAASMSPVARLNALAEKYRDRLEVRFLQVGVRPVFEIFWDDAYLVFANDSPLGLRSEPSIPRAFRGVQVANALAAQRYSAVHLSFQEGDFIKKIAVNRSTPVRRNRSKPTSTKKMSAAPKRRISGKNS